MKALIYTGHPAWKDGLNEEVRKRWEYYLKQIPEITSYRIYNVYGKNFADLEATIEDEEILIGFYLCPAINENFFRKHPNVKYIATLSMGYEGFDREAVKRHGVTCTVTVYGAMTIAQFAFALLLDICHNIRFHSNWLKHQEFTGKDDDLFVAHTRQIELYRKTIGIVGLGHVGLWLAKMASGFGMKVIANSRTIKTGEEYEGIEQVSIDELYERADVVALTCSANPSTKRMICKDTISKMKDGVIILNTSRGSLIDESALVEALHSGKVYAAGLDASEVENCHQHTPLLDCENAIVTPHIAWFAEESRMRVIDVAMENLRAYLDGNPKSVV